MTTKTRGRPGTQPEINEFRRQRLMEATIALLAEKGVAGATVRAITTAAGTSHGLIGHYYASKDELLVAALDHLFTAVAAEIARQVARAGEEPLARLKAVPRAMFSPQVFTETSSSAFLALWHEIRFNEVVREANRQLYVGYRNRSLAQFRAAAEKLGIAIDAEGAATGLIALIDGLWLELAIGAGSTTRQKAVVICHDYIDHQLGLRPDGRRTGTGAD
ncbi:MAG: transcriptional regulator BetI [Proteobacteria bacterium]|nr:transcriptional regulator BetI [Pseudomonadota bacterium]